MERRSWLGTILGRDTYGDIHGRWRGLVLGVCLVFLLLGTLMALLNTTDTYLRMTGLTLICASAGGLVLIGMGLLTRRTYNTGLIIAGILLAVLCFLLALVFFAISYLY